MSWYTIKTGMNWTADDQDVRAEPGEVRDDVPAGSVPWLLADGHIEAAEAPQPVTPEPVAAPAAEPAAAEPGTVAVQVPAADLAAVEALLHPPVTGL